MKAPETIVVNARATPVNASPGLRPQDVLFVLFRHKWKILLLGLLGLGAAASYYLLAPPEYVSEARILIRYVLEQRSVTADDSASIRSPDSRGDNIINSELEILTSFDITEDLVNKMHPTNIVTEAGLTDDERRGAAQAAVRKGLGVEVPRRSNGVRITFTHPDRKIAHDVLTNLISAYLNKHREIHRGPLGEAGTRLAQLEDNLRKTESDLRALNAGLGTVSFEDAKKSLLEQIAKTESELFATEAQHAEQRAALALLTNSLSVSPKDLTNSAVELAVPPAKLNEYRGIIATVESLNQERQRLLLGFTPNSDFVRSVDRLLAEAQGRQDALEEEIPGIPMVLAASPTPSRPQPLTVGRLDPRQTMIELTSLDAKRATLQAQLMQFRTNAAAIAEAEDRYTQLTRKREIENNQVIQLTRSIEQAKLETDLNQGQIANISVVQEPTPASRNSAQRIKVSASLAGGGIALGLILALLLEFYFDQSIRRPIQVERLLRLPLYLSIPRLRIPKRRPKRKQAASGAADSSLLPAKADLSYSNGSADENLGSYAEALRDRLMMYFQLQGLNHKPKLVGVTSCGRGAGVTTLATSLAASLSETGDGNVLFVDVNPQRGPSEKPFHHGKLRAGINDALEDERRDAARVDSNLYMVSLADPNSGRVGVIPKTLAGLVPKMKSSDYDYIIFDLPPITQTSATSKIAGLLDMVFVVMESEKTQADLAKKATDLLTESRANVAAVLNKHRRYLPTALDTDL